MGNEKDALFIQRIGKTDYEDRVWSSIKILAIFIVPILFGGIILSMRASRIFGNVLLIIFVFFGIIIIGILTIRYLSIPDENKLIVYPDSITFYNSFLWGRHVNLRKEEIHSITKIGEDQRSRREIAQDAGPFMRDAEYALEVEESSPYFQTTITYNLHSTKSKLPLPFLLFMSKWHVYSWFLIVKKENETDFLDAIKSSQFHDRLKSHVILGWKDYWQKKEG